ncbi:hypothetical protein ACI65C_008933 [Semiaphis heraclei]
MHLLINKLCFLYFILFTLSCVNCNEYGPYNPEDENAMKKCTIDWVSCTKLQIPMSIDVCLTGCQGLCYGKKKTLQFRCKHIGDLPGLSNAAECECCTDDVNE